MNDLKELSIYDWIVDNDIRTEVGLPLDFRDHRFMFDIYNDLTPIQVLMKAAQITASTCFSLKVPWVVKNIGMDAIYTLPTETDRNSFVGGKINRMIAQNPVLQKWTKDKDSVEQKQIGENLIHYRGTWTSKAAIMVPSDLNVYDEIDASKQSVIEQYATRLQHSKYRWEWYLSHPSAEGFGIHKVYEKSDQKHWFIECSHCGKWQYLDWPASIDLERQIFQCKECGGEIYDKDRRNGRWVRKYDREISGYWIPLLICPWVSAKEIIGYYNEKSEEYFYNKVLGLPFTGKGNKLTKNHLLKNLTSEIITPTDKDRMIIGVDTGLKIDYVMGGVKGLSFHGECEDYTELDKHMKEWPKAIAIVDGGGDLIGSRKFQRRWPGRVFICYLTGNKTGTDEPNWNEDEKQVTVDRNKYIQIVVDEFIDGDILLQGTEDDWYEYWLDWNNLTRIKVVDETTGEFKGHKWIRSGRDHKALATVFWKVGMTKFGKGEGKIFTGESDMFPTSAPILANNTILHEATRKLVLPEKDQDNDWRS